MSQEPEVVSQKKRRRPRRHHRSARQRILPNIFFCGDPHGFFDHINAAAREYKPDAMIILGDLQPPAPLDEVLAEALKFTQIWWIPGNHDTDSDEIYDRLWRSKLAGHNLHGRVANVAGLRVAGLGGVFRGQIWMPEGAPNYFCPATFIRRMGPTNVWRGGLPRRHRSTIFPSVYNSLMHQAADILVSHEAPGCHRKGFAALDRLGRSLKVRWYFHGHQHEDRVYGTHLGMTVRAVGYRGIVNLKGEVIVPAQLDPREAATLQAAFDWAKRDELVLTRTGEKAPIVSTERLTNNAEPVKPETVPGTMRLVPGEMSGGGLSNSQIPKLPLVRSDIHTSADSKSKRPTRVIGFAPEATMAEHEAAIGREIAKLAPGGRWKPRVEEYKTAKNRGRRNRYEKFGRLRKAKINSRSGNGGNKSSGSSGSR